MCECMCVSKGWEGHGNGCAGEAGCEGWGAGQGGGSRKVKGRVAPILQAPGGSLEPQDLS